MSQGNEILQVFKKYWRIIVRWVLGIHDFPEITVDDLKSTLENGKPVLMIDIRSEDDYMGTGDSSQGHIPGAVSIPILELESRLDELEEYREKEIVTMCPGGGLSLAAVDIMEKQGFKKVRSLKGGIGAWRRKGYPMVTGKS